MKILYLGPPRPWLETFLKENSGIWETSVIQIDQPTNEDFGADWIVSYGYRYKVPHHVLDCVYGMGGFAVNIHIGYLPWNRGADPNLWSWVESTPKGVTVHWMTEAIDQGPVITQELVEMGNNETLATSYEKLTLAADTLFRKTWPYLMNGRFVRPQGSFHMADDKKRIVLPESWDTPVSKLKLEAR